MLGLLFDISHLLQVWQIALVLDIDHGIGVYEVDKFCFADPFVGYGFAFLEFDGVFVTIGDAEEDSVDRIVGYEVSDVCECACIDAGFLPQFPSGAGIRILAFQGRAASGGFKVSAVVGLAEIPLHQKIITICVPNKNLADQMVQSIGDWFSPNQITSGKDAVW